MTKLAVHWQRTHSDNARDTANFERWKPKSVTIITNSNDVKGIECVPEDALVVVRHYPMSVNWKDRGFFDIEHARVMARDHVAVCCRLADWIKINYPGSIDNVVFTGLNEPNVWSIEPPLWTAAYYAEFLRKLHTYGLHGVALNFGVGWPTNTGVGTPPNWEPFEEVHEAMQRGDFVGLHEYCDEIGPEDVWGWWMGRYTQCPWDVPIIIGECGVDQYVADPRVDLDRRGWRERRLSPQEYIDQLAWYDAQLQKDPRIHSAQMFTYDFSHPWSSFDIRGNDFMHPFLDYVENLPDVPEPEPPEPEPPEPGAPTDDEIRDRAYIQMYPAGIARNTGAAFYQFAHANRLGLPVTNEFGLGTYRCQGFIEKIVVATIGQWDNLWVLEW